MARIRYDCYLLDRNELITITNADTDRLTETTSASFTNPPIRMKILNIEDERFESMCLNAINDDEIKIGNGDILRMVRGELPGWRLVGAEFEPGNGFSAYFANEHFVPELAQPNSSVRHNYHNVEGVMFHFLAGGGCLEVELEVDYADGLPVRHYIGNVVDDEDNYKTTVTEYLGKRKVRKLEFSENEYGDEKNIGHLCHITEY